MAESKKTKEVTFLSRYLRLRIVMNASYSKEVDGRRVTVPGRAIRFDQGVYKTSDPEEVAFIEGRPEFGKLIQKVPANTKDLTAAQQRMSESLEEREARVAAREAKVAEDEARLKSGETGREEGGDAGDGLEELKVAELKEVAEKERITVPSRAKREDLIAAIRAGREDAAAFED